MFVIPVLIPLYRSDFCWTKRCVFYQKTLLVNIIDEGFYVCEDDRKTAGGDV